MARLKEIYDSEIVAKMKEKFGYTNPMQVPKLDKIVVNMGVGEAKENVKVLESAVRDMEIITGQKGSSRSPRSPSRTSRSVKACRSAARSLSAAKRCMSLRIV